MMREIYGGAYLTIAAANAVGSDDGFLDKRRNYEFPLKFESPATHELPAIVVYGRRKFDHSGFKPFLTASEDDPEKNPLRHRAWCFQEHLLSHRILHFGKEEMFFECEQSYTCECGSQEAEFSIIPCVKLGFKFEIQHFSKDPKLVNIRWMPLIGEYSHRKMTRPSDKLAAISGVAKIFHEISNIDYLAGHWNDADLIPSLSWQMSSSGKSSTVEQQSYRAPSWSWASMNGHVDDFVLLQDNKVILPQNRIIGARCQPSGKDPTGPVTGGYLIVKGLYLEATLEKGERPSNIVRCGASIWLDRDHEGPFELQDTEVVACWYLGNWSDGDTILATTHHEMMVLRKISETPRVCQRVGWATVTDRPGYWGEGTDEKAEIDFLDGFEDSVQGFAII
jgi:hypothetical protein